MSPPTLADLRASTADLLSWLEGAGWSDEDVAAPSLCEGWSRGHVLTHLARNSDGIAATLAGALRGEIVERYPDGWDARNAAIDAGARRRFADLATDVRESAHRLDAAFEAVASADAWNRETEHGHPARHWLLARWTEVEIHRVDLAAGYEPDQWPAKLVGALLERDVPRVADRTPTPLLIVTDSDGDAGPREWRVGAGEPVQVRGPDWAVLAWLAGRPSRVSDRLTAAPDLGPYR
jgi:maleylpyruvate isomerase